MEMIRSVALGDLPAEMDQRADGTVYVRSKVALPPVAKRLTDRLVHWAATAPDRVFLAQRDSAGAWRKVTYQQAYDEVRHLASAILARKLSVERPLMVLSGNDIEQGLLSLAAMLVGVPFVPVSPAYSLISTDFDKLRGIVAKVAPGLIYVTRAEPFAKAFAAVVGPEVEVMALSGSLSDRSVTAYQHMATHAVDEAALASANEAVGPDTIAKILFTSGSTGQPKGVINTQRMLCANQSMLSVSLAMGAQEPPVLVDWLPWHHTFGGNHNFGYVLNHGGSLYIDEGKPTPQGIAATARNLTDVAPTLYFNVPKGYEELVQQLKSSEALRRSFFSRLHLTFYAGAGLPPHVARMLDELAVATVGEKILMVTSLGSTETAPASLFCTKETARPGVVGVPLPQVEIKLVPVAEKLELRLRGPNVTPGYWKDAEQTAKAFDDEGFYCIGDALKFAVPGDPNGGFVFDGRISEDFKLVTGTWVSVGPLRGRLIAGMAPLIKDAVIAGHDRDDIMALLVPDADAMRAFVGAEATQFDETALFSHPALRAEIGARLDALAQQSTGSSTRIARVLILREPLSIDANEITDKGSINQRAVLTRRAALVEALYADPPSPDAIAVS
jgi:feruloyl-CoA synthase